MKQKAKIKREHTAPWECSLAKEEKSKCRPGSVPKSDRGYFEILSLCVLQAGLGWGMIRKNWKRYKRGFLNFDIKKLAKAEIDDLLKKKGIIKNRKKIMAILENAKEFEKIKIEHGSFSDFLSSLNEEDDDEIIAKLTQRFSHLGTYSAEYFLHSVGYW